jgi:8-oxo-dGTP diphosphatase
VKHITVVTLAHMVDEQLLIVRKKGSKAFILPGGKPEPGETEQETLCREIREELGCGVAAAVFLGTFHDDVAEMEATRVTVKLYAGQLVGSPRIDAELEEMVWIALNPPYPVPLQFSMVNHIMPYLLARAALPKSEPVVARDGIEPLF